MDKSQNIAKENGMGKITPKVNETQEFIEIAFDFSNPLELVREAISNSFDAEANHIKIGFETISDCGETVLKITLQDNGKGMDIDGLQSFFDLGNSMSRGDENKIGEKGHGTKVYLNCKRILVETVKDEKKYIAIMDEPKRKLHNREIPTVDVEETEALNIDSYTIITILGYNNNRRSKFTHENVKDYILWFSKMGSIEREFGINKYEDMVLELKGVDASEYETIKFGHIFPKESKNVDQLFETYMVDAPKYYCKKIIKTGSLKNSPEIKYQAVFYIEGTKVKYNYNRMIKRSGYSAPEGAYTIQERYGLWICKDYLPIQRKNEWITKKGSEYTRFHAFINCQGLNLTANRGSIENTPSEIIQDLQQVAEEIYESIITSSDWFDIDYLESQVDAYNTVEKEKKDFKRRLYLLNKAKIADYKGIRLVEPQKEQGVFSLFLQLSQIEKSLFPFSILDYDTHSGIDVIVKENDNIPIISSKLYYVEFKNRLDRSFNHSFENLYSIICWDINLKHGDSIEDIAKKSRTLKIVPAQTDSDYTHYFLDDISCSRKIEVFVLKTYLEEKLGISFKHRTMNDCY